MKVNTRQRRKAYHYLILPFITLLASLYALYTVILPAHADDAINDWSWTKPAPSVDSVVTVNDVDNQYCSGSYTYTNVYNEKPRWICVKQNDYMKVGMQTEGQSFRTFVQFPFDTQMYPVMGTGSCEVHGQCIYVPDGDLLITKQNLINSIVRSLVIYRNFTKRLSSVMNTQGTVTSYRFDDSHPDYIFKSTANYPWPVEALGVSNNGKWLAVEFRQRGFGKLNLENFRMTRYSTEAFSYTGGSDVTPELAITNNGNHIAMMGTNHRSLVTADIGPSCEDEASDRNLEFVIPMNKPCKRLVNDTSKFMDNFWSAHNPQFNDDDTELDFYASVHGGGLKTVSLVANGYTRPRVDYLALGDSFTSGEGENDDSYYQKGTNDQYEKCHVSRRSYPYLIAQMLGVDQQFVHNVACSGAKTEDIVGKNTTYWGQNDRLGEKKLNLDRSIKTIYQNESLDTFTPGRIHQESFLRKYKPKIITIGIGGNNIGFSDKLRSCVGFDSCEWASTAEGREKTALEIQSSFDTLVNTYASIQNASPGSKLYVIGYPKLVDKDGVCSFFNGILLDSTERTFMNEAVHYINEVIKSAAKKVGVTYIDVENSFGEKVLCGALQPSDMNAIKVGDDSPIFSVFGWLKLIGSESFHPKPSGHQSIASTITSQQPDLLNNSTCPGQVTGSGDFCPDNSIVAPIPSDYWLTSGKTHGYPNQHIADFVQNPSESLISHKQITTHGYTFTPGSSVSIEIHSNPVKLDSAIVDDSGAISLGVDLPQQLGEGYHTIHLLGISYSGQPIDLYQVIKYELPHVDVPENNEIQHQVKNPIDTKQSSLVITKNTPTEYSESSDTDDVNDIQNAKTNTNLVESSSNKPTSEPKADFAHEASTFSPLIFLIPAGLWLIAGVILELRSRAKRFKMR